jgi:WD40 repeat protein
MFSPDDQYIVSGNIEGQVKFWQTQSGQLLHTEQHE